MDQDSRVAFVIFTAIHNFNYGLKLVHVQVNFLQTEINEQTDGKKHVKKKN